MTSRRRVTLVDVAAAAAVSPATVSLVLRDSPSIPQRTADRVRDAAARLGYVYNRGAAGLRAARSGMVGVVVNDLTNPYFAEIVAAIQDAMAREGRVVVMSSTAESPDRQAAFVDKLREYNVDAVVVSPAAGTDPAFLRRIRAWGLPCIQFSRDVPGAGADFVGADNRGGMQRAVRHLVDLGHRRIAMVGVDTGISTGRERLDGYRDALAGAGIPRDPALEIACPATRADGMAAVSALLDRASPPTAVACFNDILAFGAMLALLARGLAPGRDVSVTGFDDIAEAALWRPALTTVAVPRRAIGEAVIGLLDRRLQDPAGPPERVLVEVGLVVRDSTAPLENDRWKRHST